MHGDLTLMERLEILAGGAKYDVSCASSGGGRRSLGGIGNGSVCGICHSWTSDGRCVSLLKILARHGNIENEEKPVHQETLAEEFLLVAEKKASYLDK